MEGLFSDMLETLRIAREAVRGELGSLSQKPFVDRQELEVLEGSVCRFAKDADALDAMMAERHAGEEYVAATEDLVDFFRDARKQLEAMLAAGRGG